MNMMLKTITLFTATITKNMATITRPLQKKVKWSKASTKRATAVIKKALQTDMQWFFQVAARLSAISNIFLKKTYIEKNNFRRHRCAVVGVTDFDLGLVLRIFKQKGGDATTMSHNPVYFCCAKATAHCLPSFILLLIRNLFQMDIISPVRHKQGYAGALRHIVGYSFYRGDTL